MNNRKSQKSRQSPELANKIVSRTIDKRGTESIDIDIRLIAATNQDLRRESAAPAQQALGGMYSLDKAILLLGADRFDR